MNAKIGKGLRLYAASLFFSSLSGASPPGVELVLLLDASQLEAGDSSQPHVFIRDLLDNLPPRVSLRAFQFGGGPELIPCDPVLSECLGKIPAEGGSLTLQQALSKAKALLCPKGADPEVPGRALIVMSGSTGERLALAENCRIELIALGMSPGGDPALRELAREVRGVYNPLAKARGFSVATHIRKKVWQPAVRRALNQKEDDPEAPPLAWLGSGLAAFLALSCGAVLHFARHRRRTAAEPRPARSDPAREAGLRIGSGTGSGTAFSLDSRQPVILGGTHAGHSSAHLLIDDPRVAGEHCRIYAEGNAFFVDDLGSGQGTFVNEEPIAGRKALAPGDQLRIGGTTFEFLYR